MLGLFFSACQDPCQDTYCEHGTCADGACLCPDGYWGAYCEKPWSARFAGYYLVDETCTLGPGGYFSAVDGVGGAPDQLKWQNFRGLGLPVTAQIVGEGDSIQLPPQRVGADSLLSGGGKLNTLGGFEVHYFWKSGAVLDTCSSIFQVQ